MVQLTILTGNQAGAHWVAHRFPVQVGRAPNADLCVQEDGVWENHLQIHMRSPEGFLLAAQPQAFVAVNGQAIKEAILRNGDLIEFGALRIRFGLAPTRRRGLRLRESLVWFTLAALCGGQIALIYWLLD